MSPLLVALLLVMVVPLFVATWRTSLVGLSCQGLLMTWIAYRLDPEPSTIGAWLTLIDLALVRGVLAPLVWYRVLLAQGTPARNDVIAPNLLSWSMALSSVLVAFSFAERFVPDQGEQRVLMAVATAGLLLGFLVLASQSGHFSQLVGALRVENAIALFELGGTHQHAPVAVQLSQITIVVLTILLYRNALSVLGARDVPGVVPAPEGPTL